jgi:Uma2 family endonuclease
VLLLIEVADTSAEIDRTVKVPLYARSGICEVWVVDLSRIQIDVFRCPTSGGDVEHEKVGRGGSLRPGAFPHLELAADPVIR